MSLYHYEIGLPARYRHPMAEVRVEWSKHAMTEANKDKYGIVPVTNTVDLKRFSTVEVETDERGVISKIVVRGRLDDDHDVCYVLIPRAGRPWFIKTVWLNRAYDTHQTLNRARYDVP